MILAIDVGYRQENAIAAAVVFNTWQDSEPVAIVHSKIDTVAEYESGQFYKRELPCVLALLQQHQLKPKTIVIDGFVSLDAGKPGLGMHLFEALNKQVPIVGVAKTAFKESGPELEVLRGDSARPLFVTAVGIELEEAKQNILSMHGKHRIPTLLKRVDRESRIDI